jgi:hypothetical protein
MYEVGRAAVHPAVVSVLVAFVQVLAAAVAVVVVLAGQVLVVPETQVPFQKAVVRIEACCMLGWAAGDTVE